MPVDKETLETLVTVVAEALEKASVGRANESSETAEAAFQVKPPPNFNLNEPAEWSNWARQFELFRNASGLYNKCETQQISMLVYCMGPGADELLNALEIPEKERESYDNVKKAFFDYFSCKRNLFLERSKFINHFQKPGSSVDEFINDLYYLSSRCDWSCEKCKCSYNENMIMLKLVTGLADKHLSAQLQTKELSLKHVIDRIRQFEQLQHRPGELNSYGEKDTHVEQARVDRKVNAGNNVETSKGPRKPGSFQCFHCGSKRKHKANACWAKFVSCYLCKKQGHSKGACRLQKRINELNDVEWSSSSSSNIESVVVAENRVPINNKGVIHSKGIFVTCIVNNCPVKFKLDTGADVTCLGEEHVKKLNLCMRPTSLRLKGPGDSSLTVLGSVDLKLKYKSQLEEETAYVLKGQKEPLLSRGMAINLGLVSGQVETIVTNGSLTGRFPKVFNGLGKFVGSPFKIELLENYKPYSISCPRRIPLHLKEKVKLELDRMINEGVITKIDQPTEWCSPIVVVPKKNGSVRMAVDYTMLNQYVKREKLILPSVDECLARIGNARVFSKLDANSGFWQVPLDPDSALLTTFITPFGRFFFNRMPFGISSAPEHFQRRTLEMADGLEGVINLADDFLVFGDTPEQHDKNLVALLKKFESYGLTLNAEKCEFKKTKIKFLGHVIDDGKILPDPDKVKAVESLPSPTNRTELRRFMGMINYLMKFVPGLSSATEPLKSLLSEKNEWLWSSEHESVYKKIKQMIGKATVLVSFNPNLPLRVSADASSFGLGAVIEMNIDGVWKPIQFISRTLSPVERRYAQIEKEALASTWACERFAQYLIGCHFILRTDHKPLVQLLGDKPIDDLTARLQRFRMRLTRFDFQIVHVPGKQMLIADALSREPLNGDLSESADVLDELELNVSNVIQCIEISDRRLRKIQELQKSDPCSLVIKECIASGDWSKLKHTEFYKERGDLVFHNGLILKGHRVFVPKGARSEMLSHIHDGHLGIVKCISRAKLSVWWPGITVDIKKKVEACPKCLQHRDKTSEPLRPTRMPEGPWQEVSVDLAEFQGKSYLVLQDYFSKYIEVILLANLRSFTVIKGIKEVFARHGVPFVLRSDNGTQFTSSEFLNFAEQYNFSCVTSSPRYAQSNGQAESAVKVVKRCLKKNNDLSDGLLAHRSTPLFSGVSPAELLFGRRIRTNIPIDKNFLKPDWSGVEKHKAFWERDKTNQKFYFDRRHHAKELRPLLKGERVYVKDLNKYGWIVSKGVNDREYLIDVQGKNFRRNNVFIQPAPLVDFDQVDDKTVTVHGRDPDEVEVRQQGEFRRPIQEARGKREIREIPSEGPTMKEGNKTRSGRLVVKPKRFC